ncbi:MAG: hypothetical protein WAZ77_14960, partial [Candidatus Nitrosopolaris sp.]
MKAIVIQQWLEGKTRDQIAGDNALSTGTITNITNEWRSNLGYPVAEDLRELAVTLRKLRMDPSRCALGARIASMMKIFGLDEEEFDQFISVIYKDCITLGIKPNKVADNLKQLLELCQQIPLPEIPNYIQQQKTQKRKLEQELQELEARVLDAKNRADMALKEERITRQDLNFKRDLWKREISMDETLQFLDALEGIRKLGFDPATAVAKYRNFLEREAGNIAIEELRKEVNNLHEKANAHRLVMSEFEQLKSMGFGLKDLKQLANTVKEIAEANSMSPYYALQKFFADIESQYDEKLGFELKLENLKSEIQENELRRAAGIQNKSYGFDWGPFGSLFSGVDTQQRQVKPGDNFQRIHQVAATESQQHAKTKGANVTGPGNVLQIQATNSNVDSTATSNTKNNNFAHSEEDKEQQEQDGLYKDVKQLQQQQQQPNNASKNNNNNSHPANNIESTIQKFISNSLTGQAANSSNFLNYENSKYGVKLQYPSDWVYMEGNSNPSNTSLSPQIIVIFTSLKSLQQQPIASLGIGVMNLGSRKITLDEFTKLNLNNLRESNPDFQLIGSNSITLFGSNQANELVYTDGGEKKHHCTLFTIIPDKVY